MDRSSTPLKSIFYHSPIQVALMPTKRLITLLLLWLLLLLALPSWAKEPVRVGILAFRPKIQVIEQWGPLASYLQKELGQKVRLTAYSYPELENAVLNKKLDVVITNPANYILLQHNNNLSAPLVTLITNNNGNELTSFGGVMFTRAGSHITKLSDIHEHKVAVTKYGSLGGYQMQAYELFLLGLKAPQKEQLLITGMPHDNVVNAILSGKADVGFVRSGVLESMTKDGKVNLAAINILNPQALKPFPFVTSTQLYPEWPIATMSHVEAYLARQITVALLSLQPKNPAAIKADIHGFTIPANYTQVENLLRELRIAPFNKVHEITVIEIWEQKKSEITIILGLVLLLIIIGLRLIIQNRFIKQKELHLLSVQDNLNSTLNAIPDSMFELGLDGTYYRVWTPDSNLLLAEESKLIGKKISDVMEQEAAKTCLKALQEANVKNFSAGHQIKLSLNNKNRWFELSVEKKELSYEDQPVFIVLSRNITARKLAEKRDKYHRHILKLITSGQLLPVILEAIVLGVEDENSEMLCSILLLDETGKHLLNGAAPSFPDFYNEATHGMDIGVGEGSCGTSAYTGKRVIVDDIQSHPYWKNFKEAAGKAGLGACWSQPIRSTEGEVLGTFAIYHRDVHKPTEDNIELIEQVADLASIAIENIQTKLTLQSSEERYALAMKGTQEGIWDWNISTNEIIFTPRWKSMLGYTENEIKDEVSEWERLVHPDDLAITLSRIREFLNHKTKKYIAEFRMKHKDGQYINILSRAFASENEAGEITRLVGTHVDITQQTLSEEKLKLAASVFTHAGESIAITDAEGIILDVNDTFTHTTGYSREEAIGNNPRILQSGRQSHQFYIDMWQALLNKGYWAGEVWNRRKNGEVYAVMTTMSAVRDVRGETTHYVSLSNDITPIKKHQEQLERIAHFDLLTNLPNRVLLADRLSQAMLQCGRHEQSLAVVFLDLDTFKAVNDTHGHDVGDELLIVLSLRMKEALRENDTLSRIGGDEFIAVLADLDKVEDCEPVLERLLQAASKSVNIGNVVLNVSASIGVTIYPQDNVDTDQLIRHADQAMYVAKQSGKNRYHLFDTAQDDAMKIQRESLEAIRNALDNHEFLLHYQPKVNMKTGEVTGAEALIRWQHPKRGLLNPIEFLPVIENHAMMIEMGEWVIDSALSQISQWQKMGLTLPISISVNIAAVQLQQSDFTQRLIRQLADHPEVDPCRLELEILETSVLEDLHHVSTIMNDCMELGVNFALDDFGTGYSSLTYLRRLPAGLIKIDQTFVRDMLNDSNDMAIVEGVIGLAKSFKRDVIAEGVETIEHGTALLQLGCELAQGYGIAKPMPASDILVWIRDWKPDANWQL